MNTYAIEYRSDDQEYLDQAQVLEDSLDAILEELDEAKRENRFARFASHGGEVALPYRFVWAIREVQ